MRAKGAEREASSQNVAASYVSLARRRTLTILGVGD
jgi:hypothetical protein